MRKRQDCADFETLSAGGGADEPAGCDGSSELITLG
jgi:hypothetical protein